ncbi:MAG TPA: ATP-binding protein [Noviherbaspirillum sp.]|nr:ATP-binding protein [Noviherbaspirillum sp.]
MTTATSYFKIASELSSGLIAVSDEKLHDAIPRALHQIIGFFDADCCAVFKSADEDSQVELIHAAGAGNSASSCSSLDAKELARLLLRDVLHSNENLVLGMRGDFPSGAMVHRARLANLHIDSLLLIPIAAGIPASYLFMLASTRGGRDWSRTQLSQLRLLAEIVVSAICRFDMQDALQRAARDLSEAHRIGRLGTWEWEVKSGRIVDMDGVQHILGVRPESQEDFMKLVQGSERDQLQKAIDKAVSKEGDRKLTEYRIRTGRGDTRIVRSSFEVLRTENGPHIVGTFHDVTEMCRGEQELQLLRSQQWHANRIARTGVLIASLAHELSQPLSAILSNAQAGLRFLSREPLDVREIHDALTDIVSDNRRARQIIDALRAMIRREKTRRVRVDATDIMREALDLLHSEFVSHHVEVDLSCENGCFVLADKTQIEQVLLNLLLNSIESMRTQPMHLRRVKAQVQHIGAEEVQVSVCDTGIGIPPDQIEDVFEAFWTSKSQGLGMGLAVCRSIVEAHCGRIWAERNSEHGVTFLFHLPAVASP